MLPTPLACALALAAAYLAAGVLYRLGFSLAGLLPHAEPVARDRALRRFAVFVIARRDHRHTAQTARRALKQAYPPDRFSVFVLADDLRAATLAELQHLDATVVVTGFADAHARFRDSPTDVLRAGLRAAGQSDFDAVLLLDADEELAPDFLAEADRYLAAGFRAVQGPRTPPPTVPAAAADWDTISEAVGQHILGAGHHAVGLSARVSTSGTVVERGLLAGILGEGLPAGPLPQALAFALVGQGTSVAYAPRALVYSAPVGSATVGAARRRDDDLSYAQRARYLRAGARALVRGRFDLADQALQVLLPPQFLLPVVLLLLTTATAPYTLAWSAAFATLLLLNAAGFAVALPPRLWGAASWLLVSQLPALVWRVCRPGLRRRAVAKTGHGAPVTAPVRARATSRR